MNIVNIIILAVTGFFALIGIIVGLVKGFTRVKSWAVELLLTGAVCITVSTLALKKLEGPTPAIISLALSIGILCAFMLLFAVLRKVLAKEIERRKQLSYYKQYDEIEDNTEQILSAIGTEDKKQYKKLTKRKFRQSGGVWSILDRVFGGLTLAIKGAVIAVIMISFALAVIDFSRLAAEGGKLYSAIGGFYESGLWQSLKNYFFDFLFIWIVMLCLKFGFSNGITSSLWTLAMIGLIVGSGILAFNLAFKADEFVSAAASLEVRLADKLSGISGTLGALGLTTMKISQIIIGLIIFVLLLVVDILIAIFVPKLIDRARDGVIFRSIDGVLGAIMLTTLIVGILLVVGAVANSMHDLEFMNVFNAYFEKSGVATYIYDKNLLNRLGLLQNIPIVSLLK